MFRDQLNSISRGSHHSGTTSFNELLAQFKTKITNQNLYSVSPGLHTLPGFSNSNYVKKRSYSDQATDSQQLLNGPPSKRPRTAPPSPPSLLHQASGFQLDPTLSRPQLPVAQRRAPITLPSLSDALCGMRSLHRSRNAKSIIPTVSLDYFDTYKPNDENWRYGLLDSIKSSKPSFNLSNYSYLGKHVTSTSPSSTTKLPSIHQLEAGKRPHFDARVSSKVLPTLSERKINFPYESNYTYLNKTYLTDVKRYPEYLELAQSLIQLSRPQQYISPKPYYPTLHTFKQDVPSNHKHDHDAVHQDQHDGDAAHHYHPHHQHHHQHQTLINAKYEKYLSSHYDTPKEQYSNYPTSPSSSRLSQILPMHYATPENSFEFKSSSTALKKEKKVSLQRTRFIPITPPSVKDKTRSELMKSPPRSSQAAPRMCISCGSDQSPCWRPSWSIKEGQLCNSCGLRYKKTASRCLNDECKKIPAKGEWSVMQTKGKTKFEDGEEAYSCLDCGWKVEVKK